LHETKTENRASSRKPNTLGTAQKKKNICKHEFAKTETKKQEFDPFGSRHAFIHPTWLQ